MNEQDDQRGGIIRVQHDTNRPFFVLSKALAEDERLSYGARGLMCYLLAKPDDWDLRMTDLIRNSPAGLRHVRALLQELEKVGYVTRVREQTSGGLFLWITTVYESPSAQNVSMVAPSAQNVPMVFALEREEKKRPSARYPSVDEPSMDEPSMDNVPIYRVLTKPSTKRLNTKNKEVSQQAAAAAAVFGAIISPTDAQRLVETHPACIDHAEALVREASKPKIKDPAGMLVHLVTTGWVPPAVTSNGHGPPDEEDVTGYLGGYCATCAAVTFGSCGHDEQDPRAGTPASSRPRRRGRQPA